MADLVELIRCLMNAEVRFIVPTRRTRAAARVPVRLGERPGAPWVRGPSPPRAPIATRVRGNL